MARLTETDVRVTHHRALVQELRTLVGLEATCLEDDDAPTGRAERPGERESRRAGADDADLRLEDRSVGEHPGITVHAGVRVARSR
jgi:hypothetical protein